MYNDDECLRRIELSHVAAVTYRGPKSKERAYGAHLTGAVLAIEAECVEISCRRKRERQRVLAPAALFKEAQASIIERIKAIIIQDFILAIR
jgi:hypothetical protein